MAPYIISAPTPGEIREERDPTRLLVNAVIHSRRENGVYAPGLGEDEAGALAEALRASRVWSGLEDASLNTVQERLDAAVELKVEAVREMIRESKGGKLLLNDIERQLFRQVAAHLSDLELFQLWSQQREEKWKLFDSIDQFRVAIGVESTELLLKKEQSDILARQERTFAWQFFYREASRRGEVNKSSDSSPSYVDDGWALACRMCKEELGGK